MRSIGTHVGVSKVDERLKKSNISFVHTWVSSSHRSSRSSSRDGIFLPRSNPYIEALNLNVMISGVRGFGRKLGLDEITRVRPPGWDSYLYKKKKRQSLLAPPWEDTRRWLSTRRWPGRALSLTTKSGES